MNYCGDVLTVVRGKRASSKDNTVVKEIYHVCNRKAGHDGPHKNGRDAWGKGPAPHSFKKS